MLESNTPWLAAIKTRLAEVDKLLDSFNRTDSPGVIAAVSMHGQPIYRRAVGMASLEHRVAHSMATRVRIASTSKHFAAMAILLLIEEGLIALDDPLHKHLREFPRLSDKGPTIAQLMSHSGGWRGHDEIWAITHGLEFSTKRVGLAAMARQTEFNFEPGTRMCYSNGGYYLLATIVERVSGKTFNEFLKERLFVPLDMPDTESLATDLDVCPGLASSYMPRPQGGWRRGLYPCELEGGGSLVSTVDDLMRWLAHLRSPQKKVGKAQSWELLHTPTQLASGAGVSYGYGLFHHAYRGVNVIHHAGAVLGSTSQMLTVPSHGLDIVILVNGAAVSPVALTWKILDLVLEDVLPEAPEVRPVASDYAAMLGKTYSAHEAGCVLGFGDVAGEFGLAWQAAAPFAAHESDGRVWVGLPEMPICDIECAVGDLQGDQAPEVITVKEGGVPVRFERLPDVAPTAVELASRLSGSYHSPDAGATASFELVGDALHLSIHGLHGSNLMAAVPLSSSVLLLTPVDPVLARLGRMVLFVDADDGGSGDVRGLRLSSVRTRNLRFSRTGA